MQAEESADHPQIIAFPPLLWLIGAVCSVLLHFVFSIRAMPYRFALVLGIACLIAAPCVAFWGWRTMKAAGTNVDPAQPALTIVRSGPYRFTRNPMYLGFVVLQAALGFLLNDWISLFFAGALLLVLHFGVVLREEKYLEAKFGEPYLALKREVRRWI